MAEDQNVVGSGIDQPYQVVLRPPEIPAQGHGTHFEIGVDGRVTFAPPEALDRQGNNIARLRKLHPSLRALASDLARSLRAGNRPHALLGSRLDAYCKLIDQDLAQIDFTLLYVEGVRLANADNAAIRDKEEPPLAPSLRSDMDTLLEVHGTFMMATAEGIEAIAAADRYRRTSKEETEFQTAAGGFIDTMQKHPDVVDPRVAELARATVNEIGTGSHPERSSASATGILTNLVITMMGAATFGELAAAASASQVPVLIGATTATLQLFGEGFKKSEPFAVVAALVTQGFNKVSQVAETEVAKACETIGEQLRPQVKYVLHAESWLRRLANQRESGLNWVIDSLDWLKASEAVPSWPPAVTPKMMRFPPANLPLPASFMMGSPPGEGADGERPQRQITISCAFEVGVFPVTRGEFADFVGATSYKVKGRARIGNSTIANHGGTPASRRRTITPLYA